MLNHLYGMCQKRVCCEAAELAAVGGGRGGCGGRDVAVVRALLSGGFPAFPTGPVLFPMAAGEALQGTLAQSLRNTVTPISTRMSLNKHQASSQQGVNKKAGENKADRYSRASFHADGEKHVNGESPTPTPSPIYPAVLRERRDFCPLHLIFLLLWNTRFISHKQQDNW